MQHTRSIVIVETYQKMTADITLIVHSEDERLTQVLHSICRSAVKKAVQPLDHLLAHEEAAP